MNQTQCREKLGILIKDESLALNELSTLLDREHGLLEANDVVALEGATRERQRCVARIVRADEERRALCRDMCRPVGGRGRGGGRRGGGRGGARAGGGARGAGAAARARGRGGRN